MAPDRRTLLFSPLLKKTRKRIETEVKATVAGVAIEPELRREMIAERMKALQELVPNTNKGERLHAVLPKSQIDEDELFGVYILSLS
ncbi:hypothetical protein PIB30_020722 [Stylosanthes scabra]|uniref:Uncharacterized protein n=1 Tax=Stylosanthes scabra TaxID=79078 RepID=A0ABU6Y955_9FABA|nr:hypothetical protein [Stylosanthes scabra]